MALPRVVIIGAGFGGLQCARALRGQPVAVTLIDRNNYHLFTPLLYQVASSLLNPSDIARPIRSILGRSRNVRFRRDEVTGVDFARREVQLAGGESLGYDYLVLATGSTTNFFGLASLESTALGLKDLPEALELRNHILRCLESAATERDEMERRRLLTFAVVGGGPTGVEYAGALSELVNHVIPREYPELDLAEVRVVLVEALPAVLGTFPADLGEKARAELVRRGIEVRTSTRVIDARPGCLVLQPGDELQARTVVWAAGVKPSPLAAVIDAPKSRSGRVTVDETLRVPGQERVFVIGDLASVVQDGREVPMLSAPAMQEGRLAAANILRLARGQQALPFRYRDRGSMATIGRNAAVARIGRVSLDGFLGWAAWLVVHLYYIIGFRNRLAVLLGWAWNYLRFDRPVRIITRARERPG